MVADLKITEGDLSIDGNRVNEVAARDRDIAMVFQNYALIPILMFVPTFRSDLSVVGRTVLSRDDTKRWKPPLRILGSKISSVVCPNNFLAAKRAQPWVVLWFETAVFLLDEPLSNLDVASAWGQAERMLHRQLQATMLYVTHAQEGHEPW